MNPTLQTGHDPALLIRLEARAENVMLVRQAIEGAVREIGADPTVVDDIKLAVTEACSNVVKYAYGAGAGEMEIALTSDEHSIAVTIRDFGEWREHDATGDIELSGMGIPLMKAVTSHHDVLRTPDGTQVALEFTRRLGDAVPADNADE
ncbi:MAG: ATP-binding protein [Solirubrobacterales bacterium]